MPDTEPAVLDSTAAMLALTRLAVDAHAAGEAEAAARLIGRLVAEVAPAGLAPFIAVLGRVWLDSFRADVPPMTVAIVESDLEDITTALTKGDTDGAQAQLAEVLAWHPKAGAPDPGMPLFGVAFGALAALPGAPPVTAAAQAPSVEGTGDVAPAADDVDAPAPPAAASEPSAPAPLVVDWVERGEESLAHDPAQALACFERARDRRPDDERAWAGCGRALRGLGRAEEALAYFEHLLKVAPLEGRFWEAYADLLSSLDRLSAARYAESRVLDLAADHAAGTLAVAALRQRAGRWLEALESLDRLDAPDPGAISLRARCLLGLQRAAEALPLLQQVPHDVPDVWIERGLCLERLGRTPEALTCYQRAHPASPRRWLHLARHDATNARTYFERALAGFQALARSEGLAHADRVEAAYARQRLRALATEGT